MGKWDLRFLDMAALVKSWSKDPSTHIGAVIVKDNRVISTGYNGFPPGIADDERLNVREDKYKLVVHAELNAILNAAKHGIALKGTTIYVDGLHACSACAKAIVCAGITRVVMRQKCDVAHWVDSLSEAKAILEEAGVEIETS